MNGLKVKAKETIVINIYNVHLFASLQNSDVLRE